MPKVSSLFCQVMHNNFRLRRATKSKEINCYAFMENIKPQNCIEHGSPKYLIKPALNVSRRERMIYLFVVFCTLYLPVQILFLYLLLSCYISVLLFQASGMHSTPLWHLNSISKHQILPTGCCTIDLLLQIPSPVELLCCPKMPNESHGKWAEMLNHKIIDFIWNVCRLSILATWGLTPLFKHLPHICAASMKDLTTWLIHHCRYWWFFDVIKTSIVHVQY